MLAAIVDELRAVRGLHRVGVKLHGHDVIHELRELPPESLRHRAVPRLRAGCRAWDVLGHALHLRHLDQRVDELSDAVPGRRLHMDGRHNRRDVLRDTSGMCHVYKRGNLHLQLHVAGRPHDVHRDDHTVSPAHRLIELLLPGLHVERGHL
jgi:hypothetical protein